MEKETFQGVVKFYNTEKRFGFIKKDNSNDEIFVHSSGLIDQIQENDRVSFEEAQGRKGINAINVTKIQ